MDSDNFKDFVGKKWGTEVTEDKLKEKGSFEGGLRVLKPDSIITMDYRDTRLNVNIDENDVITSFHYS